MSDVSISERVGGTTAPASGDGAPAELRTLLALLLTPGLGPTLVNRLTDRFGSAGHAFAAPAADWATVRGISAKKADTLRRAADATRTGGPVDRELDAVARAGARIVGLHDDAYPKLLRLIPDPPPLLWVLGELRAEDALGLGVVGSRKCSAYGREQADRFAAQACGAGLCVVSGGAYGVDIAAHRAALRVGGRTVAVIGSGLGKPYPAEHLDVFRAIARGDDGRGHGAVVSELPLGVGPRPEHFPRRNRIISGMSLGVLVVEAAKRSGALITARLTVEDHGRECMAVPGRLGTPGAEGVHELIRSGGATLVTGIADVLDQLGDAGRTLRAAAEGRSDAEREAAGPGDASPPAAGGAVVLSPPQEAVVAALREANGPAAPDALCEATGLAAGPLRGELTVLELRGVVEKAGGGFRLRRGGAAGGAADARGPGG